jgi:predicted DsbA family dithiol-disulfide isomerase
LYEVANPPASSNVYFVEIANPFSFYLISPTAQSVLMACVALVPEIDSAEAARVLEDSSAFADEVAQKVALARRMRVNGVPFFIVENQREGEKAQSVSGAQPAELLAELLEEAVA